MALFDNNYFHVGAFTGYNSDLLNVDMQTPMAVSNRECDSRMRLAALQPIHTHPCLWTRQFLKELYDLII